ncbi:MAG: tyrosine decarboxylase MfnA [Thermoplasmata archaeon]|nr:MAG: tyrosine decarboxylase MfnA [Thermoplasmata archaeon]
MEQILSELQQARNRDAPFDAILGSMCTVPHEIARKAYAMFIETNLGDHELFQGTKHLEEKAIEWVAQMLHAPPDYGGLLTSGGTESNITALWIYRLLSGKREVVVPKQAHFSFMKAASLLEMNLRVVECSRFMRARDVEKYLSDDTACVVAVAGNTPFGYIDEVEEIAEMCGDAGIFLHVDAAFGGFVAPFVSDKRFDFRTGISSISVDAHKMGMACIPCGFLLLKKEEWLEEIKVRSRCTHSRFQATLLGTRPGAAAAAAYAVMQYLGRDGYTKTAEQCMESTCHLARLLDDAGIPYVEPELNLVAIRVTDPVAVAKRLVPLNWFVGIDEEHGTIRVVCMPHVRRDMLNKFVADLQKVIS